jgi:predicted ester cyclase
MGRGAGRDGFGSGRCPVNLPDEILRAVEEGFPEDLRPEVEALLATYGVEPHERERRRVLSYILQLAKGDVAEVRKLVEYAKRDYRDIILWLENPSEARLDTPEKIRAFNAMLERFGAHWRVPEEAAGREAAEPAKAGQGGGSMDALERNKQVARRFVEEVVNTGNVAPLAELVSEDCVETDGKVREVSGVSGMAEHIRAVRAIYPDLHVTVERQVAEGEWVATVITARGTHAAQWLGMAPTHKPLVFTGVNVDRVVDGKMVEHGGAANMLEPFLTAGALRPVGKQRQNPDV